MEKENIGNNIKVFRNEIGMSQQELADKMYVTRQTVSNYEKGKSFPDVETLDQLSSIFGVSVEEIIYGKNYQNRKQSIFKEIVFLCIIAAIVFLTYFFMGIEQEQRKVTYSFSPFYYFAYCLFLPVVSVIAGVFVKRIFSKLNVLTTGKEKYLRMRMILSGILILIILFMTIFAIYVSLYNFTRFDLFGISFFERTYFVLERFWRYDALYLGLFCVTGFFQHNI